MFCRVESGMGLNVRQGTDHPRAQNPNDDLLGILPNRGKLRTDRRACIL